jgi:hypothetical protein
MTTAATQAEASTKGRQRSDSPKNYWNRPAPPLSFGDDDWRVRCFRGKGRPVLDISDLVSQISWSDTGPILTGSLTLGQPDAHPPLDISEGHVIRLDWRHAGSRAWLPVWEMRLGGPLENTGVSTNVKTVISDYQMADDLTLLARGKVNFKCKNMLVHHALARFMARESIPHGPLPRTRHRIKSFSMNASPLDIIMALIRSENTNEDRDYRIRWDPGQGVQFVPKLRSRYLLALGPTIIEATFMQRRRSDFATSLTARATTGSKQKKRHIVTTVTSAAYRRRFGLVHRSISVQADSIAEARTKTKRVLAKLLRPHREVQFTHAGIPFLRRQAALKVALDPVGFERLVWVSSVAHSLSPGSYTMDVAVQFTDPNVNTKKKTTKCTTAKSRGRSSTACTTGGSPKRTGTQTAKQKQRTDRTPGQQLADKAVQ